MSGYNGWANWETWSLSLWLHNDEGMYHWCLGFPWDKADYRQMREHILEVMPSGDTPDGADFTGERIDWDEIAESFCE